MNIINVASSTIDSIPTQSTIPMQNIAAPLNNNVSGQSTPVHVSGTKVKGASDQPGEEKENF